MTSVIRSRNGFSVKAYRGDAKTLLAFNMTKAASRKLAGFTIQYQVAGKPPQFIFNNLRFKTPANHAQDASEPANSSVNAPIHKFRWVHVPGSLHQSIKPTMGLYQYTVTPRFFDDSGSLQPLDPDRSVTVPVDVGPFSKKGLEVGFTRGYTQSQAFVNHFGLKAKIQPAGKELLFDTSQESGVNAAGEHFTFAQEYEWLGFTARQKLFDLLNEVLDDKTLRADVFAYDLNEPDLIGILLKLARQKRVRVILDNASLHHSASDPKPEDEFATLFNQAAGAAELLKRGKFGRFSHDKVVVVRTKATNKPRKVLTGSTNFSVTGLYVNSNHVLIFNDPVVAEQYARVFDVSWDADVKRPAFVKAMVPDEPVEFSSAKTPRTSITFAPHEEATSIKVLTNVADRIAKEKGKGPAATRSVLFAVMQIDNGVSPVFEALKSLHKSQEIFSYGISDSPGGIALYPLGRKTGVLVTGKPAKTQLPPPFNQVPNIGGFGHQVHHKFVVCGFNGPDPVVFCGSSNLAQGGETLNGDNLLAIFDEDVATAFAIEALTLVDHFDFLNRVAEEGGTKAGSTPPASKPQAAADAQWFLSTSDKWAQKFFDSDDLHCVDRKLFGA